MATPTYNKGSYNCATWNLLGETNQTTQEANFDILHLSRMHDNEKNDFSLNRLDCGKNATEDALKCQLTQRKEIDKKVEETKSTF